MIYISLLIVFFSSPSLYSMQNIINYWFSVSSNTDPVERPQRKKNAPKPIANQNEKDIKEWEEPEVYNQASHAVGLNNRIPQEIKLYSSREIEDTQETLLGKNHLVKTQQELTASIRGNIEYMKKKGYGSKKTREEAYIEYENISIPFFHFDSDSISPVSMTSKTVNPVSPITNIKFMMDGLCLDTKDKVTTKNAVTPQAVLKFDINIKSQIQNFFKLGKPKKSFYQQCLEAKEDVESLHNLSGIGTPESMMFLEFLNKHIPLTELDIPSIIYVNKPAKDSSAFKNDFEILRKKVKNNFEKGTREDFKLLKKELELLHDTFNLETKESRLLMSILESRI